MSGKDSGRTYTIGGIYDTFFGWCKDSSDVLKLPQMVCQLELIAEQAIQTFCDTGINRQGEIPVALQVSYSKVLGVVEGR